MSPFDASPQSFHRRAAARPIRMVDYLPNEIRVQEAGNEQLGLTLSMLGVSPPSPLAEALWRATATCAPFATSGLRIRGENGPVCVNESREMSVGPGCVTARRALGVEVLPTAFEFSDAPSNIKLQLSFVPGARVPLLELHFLSAPHKAVHDWRFLSQLGRRLNWQLPTTELSVINRPAGTHGTWVKWGSADLKITPVMSSPIPPLKNSEASSPDFTTTAWSPGEVTPRQESARPERPYARIQLPRLTPKGLDQLFAEFLMPLRPGSAEALLTLLDNSTALPILPIRSPFTPEVRGVEISLRRTYRVDGADASTETSIAIDRLPYGTGRQHFRLSTNSLRGGNTPQAEVRWRWEA